MKPATSFSFHDPTYLGIRRIVALTGPEAKKARTKERHLESEVSLN